MSISTSSLYVCSLDFVVVVWEVIQGCTSESELRDLSLAVFRGLCGILGIEPG